MDNVFKFMGGFFSSLTQLLIGFAALAVVTEVVFGAEMFPGMTVVDNLTIVDHDPWKRRVRWTRGPFDPLEHPYQEVSDELTSAVAQ